MKFTFIPNVVFVFCLLLKSLTVISGETSMAMRVPKLVFTKTATSTVKAIGVLGFRKGREEYQEKEGC